MDTPRAIETTGCTRCGGTGHYSWCQMWGTICFKCCGAGRVYTKRGAATKIYFENLLSIPAADLKIGLKVRALVISNAGQVQGNKWTLITNIGPNTTCGVYRNGTVVYEGLTIESEHCSFGGVAPTTLYRVQVTKEVKSAALAKALDYQDTLTKTGTVRKKVKC